MKSKVLLGVTFAIALGVLGTAFLQRSNVTASTIATQTPAQTTPAPADTGYTMAQVAAHNNASSCWAAIDGSVYNLTSWVSQHPGGEAAILALCGTDGSAAFNDQHGGARKPANELKGFLLGPLAAY